MTDPAQSAGPLTPAVRDAMRRGVLCWLATADMQGQPNVSPKEVFVALDDRRLAIAHIASPISLDNIVENGRVCASFVDPFTQKGVKLIGLATAIAPNDPAFEPVAAPLRAVAGPRFPIAAVFVVEVSGVAPIVAPSYLLFPETTEAAQVAAAMKTYGVRPAQEARTGDAHSG